VDVRTRGLFLRLLCRKCGASSPQIRLLQPLVDAVPFLSCFHLSNLLTRCASRCRRRFFFDCKWLALFSVHFSYSKGEKGCVHLDSSIGWLLNQPGNPSPHQPASTEKKKKEVVKIHLQPLSCTGAHSNRRPLVHFL
jgi:hypothetical protein